MAEKANGFPDGLNPEDSDILKELHSLSGTMRILADALTKVTNSSMFSSKDGAEKIIKRSKAESISDIKALIEKVTSEEMKSSKDYASKLEKILNNYNEYAKSNAEIKNISKTQLEAMLNHEKNLVKLQTDISKIQDIQSKMIEKTLTSLNASARFNREIYDAQRLQTTKGTPEDWELTKLQQKESNSQTGQRLFQQVINSNPLFRYVANMSGRVQSKSQFEGNSSARHASVERKFMQDKGRFEYGANERDISEALQKTGNLKDHKTLEFEKQSLFNNLEYNRKLSRENSLQDIELADPAFAKEKKKQARDSKGRFTTKENVIPFQSMADFSSGNGANGELADPVFSKEKKKQARDSKGRFTTKENVIPFQSMADFSSGNVANERVAKSKASTISLKPTAQDVLRVLGDAGVGYLYLGTLLKSGDDSSTSDQLEHEQDDLGEIFSAGGGGKGSASGLLSGLAGGLTSLLTPALMTSVLGALGVALGITGLVAVVSLWFNKDFKDSQSKGTATLVENVEELKGTTDYTTAKAGLGRAGIQTGEGRPVTKDTPGAVFNSATRMWVAGPETPAILPENMPKKHNGGIIGESNILAQKGEVILPVQDSQAGLSSGILEQTSNGGIKLNNSTPSPQMSSVKMEALLEQLLQVVNGNVISAIKEKKENSSYGVPSLPSTISSFSGS